MSGPDVRPAMDPLEALLFDWVAPTRENRVFEKIMKMRVIVQQQA